MRRALRDFRRFRLKWLLFVLKMVKHKYRCDFISKKQPAPDFPKCRLLLACWTRGLAARADHAVDDFFATQLVDNGHDDVPSRQEEQQKGQFAVRRVA